jgi:transcriptional regulator with XRE-family HTH domain
LPSDLWRTGFIYETLPPIMVKEPTGTAECAERLSVTLAVLKLTQAQFCRQTGVSTASLNNAITGDARIGLDNAILICQATDLTLDWLFRGRRKGLPGEFIEGLVRLDRATKPKKRAKSAG